MQSICACYLVGSFANSRTFVFIYIYIDICIDVVCKLIYAGSIVSIVEKCGVGGPVGTRRMVK